MIDPLRLADMLNPERDGEPYTVHRTGQVTSVRSDGTVSIALGDTFIPAVVLEGVNVAEGDVVNVLAWEGGLLVLGPSRSEGFPSGPVNVHRYTSSGTWTKPTGLKYVRVKVQGGGGAGGGRNSVSGQASLGSGGAGGGYVEGFVWARDLPSSAPVVVGSGGSGVSGGNGQAGGASWFGGAGTAYRLWADGGGGGARENFPVGSNGNGTLTSGGGASVGGSVRLAVSRTGQPGARAWYFGAMHNSAMTPGQGGASMMGAGGAAPGLGQTGVAQSGTGWGSGGSGLCGLNQAAAAGGAGSQGTVIVEEYF